MARALQTNPPTQMNQLFNQHHRKRTSTRQKPPARGPLPGPFFPVLVSVGLVFFLGIFLYITVNAPEKSTTTSTSSIANFFSPEVKHWEPKILQWAQENQLDPNIVATIIQIESCGNPNARSGAGAMGLFQVMPFHFYDYEDPFDPDTNALRGLGYLASSLEYADGIPYYAFAGYNGGIGIMDSSEVFWPDETIDYAYWGSGIYQDAIDLQTNSPRLEEWLSSGGTSLCEKASEAIAAQY